MLSELTANRQSKYTTYYGAFIRTFATADIQSFHCTIRYAKCTAKRSTEWAAICPTNCAAIIHTFCAAL